MLIQAPTTHDRPISARPRERPVALVVTPPEVRPWAPVCEPDALAGTLARAVAQRATPAPDVTAISPPPGDGPVLARIKSRLAPITWVPNVRRREQGPPDLADQGGGDVKARLELLGRKVERALSELDGDEETLPVFLAPEWYFTGSGRDLPYTPKEFEKVFRGLAALSDKYRGVLLVPGTIRWCMKQKEPFKNSRFPVRTKKQSVVALWNTALAFYSGRLVHRYDKQHEGGDKSNDGQWLEKHYEVLPAEVEEAFDIHQWRRDRGRAAGPQIKTGADPFDVNADWARAQGGASNLFSLDGVQFAIDICRDFGAGTALREYVHADPLGAGVDVHLVIYGGGGAELGPDTTAAQPGGYTIVADSHGGSPAHRGKVGQVESRPGSVADAAVRGDRAVYKEIAGATIDGDIVIFDPLRLPGHKRVAFA